MAYVLSINLTDAYIQSLIVRNGFTDVTSQFVDETGCLYAIQDLDGNVNQYFDMDGARMALIQKYTIIQNS